jgi:2-methylisocitrate lyase-like PEP mutase family enzyme
MTAPEVNSRRAAFDRLHRRGQPFLLPNAWDVASAVVLADAGFPAVATTSLGVTAAAGLIDGQGTGRAATVAVAAAIAARLTVPVSIDLEGGYSEDPGAVAGLVAELASAGVAGINLEDVITGGELRAPAAQAAIIRAVVAAAPGVFVNARTDVYWLEMGPRDGRLRETITRLAAYAEAGAGGVYVPGLTGLAEIESVTAAIDLPLNLLWRPDQDLPRLAGAGVARISTGSAPYRRALAAALATAVAARAGAPPPEPDLSYGSLIGLLRASEPAGSTHSTPFSSA